MAEISIEGVSKIYPGGVKAVDNVSLRIRDKEFLVLVGPSGCGKSTTLRMIAGLEDISDGVIRIGERAVNNVAPKDRDIAMVFQNYALYPHMTVFKNMAFGLMLRRKQGFWDWPWWAVFAPARFSAARNERAAIHARVKEAAAILDITHLLERRPKQLSGGQRQRVAVGRAIVRNPKAYLFDEPLSNLDAKLRVQMRSELKRLHRQVQTTTVYVTHDQEEAMTLGDRVVVMKDGVIQQFASPFEVYEKPTNRFVAGFVGTPPMNFLEGSLEAAGNGTAFVERGGGARIALDAGVAKRLAAHVGKPITMGIRPEAMTPAPTDDAPMMIVIDVAVVEPLGDRMDVSGTTAVGTPIVSRVDAKADIRENQQARFKIDPTRVHFFAPGDDGRNLLLESA
ncbi:MAG: ABC transporter ATP-binding protein [Phycisphaerae bacterium]